MKLTLNQSEFIVLKGIIDERLNSIKETLAKWSQDDINAEVNRRFQDISN